MQRVRTSAPWLWGGLVAAVVSRFFFSYGPGDSHSNHEGYSYVYRIIEFADSLRAGYAFPQWAVDFRYGLGSPYFGYYQPGFFYVAGGFAQMLSVPRALAVTMLCFSLLGYAGMFALVRARFGVPAGMLAGTALLFSQYSLVEVYFRGDLSEYAGMMLLPALASWLIGWLEDGRRWCWHACAAGCASLVVLHCVVGLLGYGLLALSVVWYGVHTRAWRRAYAAVAAMLLGLGLSAFYWLPLILEWQLVQGDRAASGAYYPVPRWTLSNVVGLVAPVANMPFVLDQNVLGLVAAASVGLVIAHRRVTAAQWRFVGVLWLWVVVGVFLMNPVSKWFWDTLPLLYRVQFPWRFLLVLTAATAGLAGCILGPTRLWAAVGIAVLAFHVAGRHPVPLKHAYPGTPADMAGMWVAPDVAGEWLPRGADRLRAAVKPICSKPCVVGLTGRSAGRLGFLVLSTGETLVTLPHYFFPVGWRATFNGQRVTLEAGEHGLMRVLLAGSGKLELIFYTTPMKWVGVAVSALVLLVWGAAAFAARRTRSPLYERAGGLEPVSALGPG